ncbi:MAG TPA: glycosyltransferase family 4 protein [Candidatus Dormibacteraeota bacterium]|jgi:glycosyltransferase involved in cell wall biosynthesis|nr:glycosyltransferase family 4 protein [Candidatus Dormibacteraeota bacterium]
MAGDGLTVYSREVTRGLDERGVEVVFFHHDPGSAGLDSVELPSLRISQGWTIAGPGTRSRLRRALVEHRIDVVHVSLAFSSDDFGLPELCHGLGLPLVATMHAPFDVRLTWWGGLSHVLYRIYAALLCRCDRVIVFGAAQARLLESMGVPSGRLRVIPNGVDVGHFRPGSSTFAHDLGAERLFVYLGRLDAEKNVALLIDAFLDSSPPPTLRLAVAGSGRERDHLERRHRDGRVAFLGLITEERRRVALLRAAEAFFLPSSIEGLSLALLEAMACGACPVATDVGCDGDVVRGAGITLDPLDLAGELGRAMTRLIDSPALAAELGRLARQRVLARYSLRANLDTLLDVYRELVPARRLQPV